MGASAVYLTCLPVVPACPVLFEGSFSAMAWGAGDLGVVVGVGAAELLDVADDRGEIRAVSWGIGSGSGTRHV